MPARLAVATMVCLSVAGVALSSCATADAQSGVIHSRADGTTVPTAMQKDTAAHPRVDMPAMADHGAPIIPPALTANPS